MEITKIEQDGIIYLVTRKPNWFESIFGIKERIDKYKYTGYTYTFGGGHLYVDKEGRQLGNDLGYGSNTRGAIDRWRNKF